MPNSSIYDNRALMSRISWTGMGTPLSRARFMSVGFEAKKRSL